MQDEQHDLVARTMAITAEQIQQHVQATTRSPCKCGSKEGSLAVDSEGRPEILMMPTARRPEIGSWFFWTFCEACGDTSFYSSYKILKIIEGSDDVRG